MLAFTLVCLAFYALQVNWHQEIKSASTSQPLAMQFFTLAAESSDKQTQQEVVSTPAESSNELVSQDALVEPIDINNQAPAEAVITKVKPLVKPDIKVKIEKKPVKSTSPSDVKEINAESDVQPVNSSEAVPTQAPLEKSEKPQLSPATSAARQEQLETTFLAQLRSKIESNKRYPTSREARLTQPQGITRVWLELNRNGELINVGILESSGSNLLDSEALRSVRLTQFPPFDEDIYPNQLTHRFSASLKYLINVDD